MASSIVVLFIAAALVTAPVSYVALLTWYWPIIEVGLGFMEIIAKAQFWALVIISPIIVATKVYEALKRF